MFRKTTALTVCSPGAQYPGSLHAVSSGLTVVLSVVKQQCPEILATVPELAVSCDVACSMAQNFVTILLYTETK